MLTGATLTIEVHLSARPLRERISCHSPVHVWFLQWRIIRQYSRLCSSTLFILRIPKW